MVSYPYPIERQRRSSLEEFKEELRRVIGVAATKPERFHLIKPTCIVRTSNASPTTLFAVTGG